MCRQTEEEVGPTVGLPRHRHLGFFNMPVQALTRGHSFLRLFRETAPFQSPFTMHIGIQRTYSHIRACGLYCSYKIVYPLCESFLFESEVQISRCSCSVVYKEETQCSGWRLRLLEGRDNNLHILYSHGGV